MEIKELSEKIKLQRKHLGMSQEDLADKLDISRQSVSKWESGQSLPEPDKLILLAKLFQVSIDYLLRDEIGPSAASAGFGAHHAGEPPAGNAPSGGRLRKLGLIVGGILSLMGILALLVLWAASIVNPAPVLGPELGFTRAFFHYLDYNGYNSFLVLVSVFILAGAAICTASFLINLKSVSTAQEARYGNLPGLFGRKVK